VGKHVGRRVSECTWDRTEGAVEYVGKVYAAGGCGQVRRLAYLERWLGNSAGWAIAPAGQERRLAKRTKRRLAKQERPSEHYFPVQYRWGFSLGGPALCASVFIMTGR